MEQHSTSFTVSNDAFSQAVAWVARSLPTKPAQPVLRGVIIAASEEGLELSGYDYELSTLTRVAADVHVDGRFAVNGKLLSDLVGTLPNDSAVNVTVTDAHAHFSCGSAKFDLPLISLEEYPQLPALPAVTGTVNQDVFRQAVSQVAIAAGKDDTLPVLTSIHMDIRGTQVEMAATDRFRLAVRRFEWTPSSDDLEAKLLIPARSLLDNARSMHSSVQQDVTIAAGDASNAGEDGLFGIEAGDRQTTTRMLKADFPKYDPLVPKTHAAMASVAIAPLLDAIKRVSLVAERNAQIRMSFTPEVLTLSAGASDAGHAEESLPCEYVTAQDGDASDSLVIAFNANYLREGLNALPGDKVLFGFTQGSRPAILIDGDNHQAQLGTEGGFPTPPVDFLYLLMPVRLPG